MPTVLRSGPYRLFFFSNENNEPPHVHVERDDDHAKLWLHPSVAYVDSSGFTARELGYLAHLVETHREQCLRSWHEHFGD